MQAYEGILLLFSLDRQILIVDEILLVFRDQTVSGQKNLFGQCEEGKGAKLTLKTDFNKDMHPGNIRNKYDKMRGEGKARAPNP